MLVYSCLAFSALADISFEGGHDMSKHDMSDFLPIFLLLTNHNWSYEKI